MPYNRAVHPSIWSRGLDSVQTTGEKAVVVLCSFGSSVKTTDWGSWFIMIPSSMFVNG